jgi:hypothetical protein
MSDSSRSKAPIPSEIQKLLGIVRGRLGFERFLAGLHDTLVISLVIILLLVVASKLSPVVAPTWWIVFSVLGGLSIIGALVISARGRLSDSALAALVDERLGLRDRFSTAIHCAGREDPFARAALEDALTTARDPENRRRLATTFAPRAPGGSWVAPMIGVIALLLWMSVPAGDVFAADEASTQQAADEERQNVEDTMRTVLEEIEENSELSEQLGDITNNFALDESRPNGEVDPEEARREALRKVSELERRLDDIVNGEQGKKMDAMRRALSEVDSAEEGEARELSEALKKGDFSEARKALEEMQQKLESSEMSEEDREELAKALEEMAEQLKKASENKESLEEALRRAGLDPSLANNPEALEQAMKQASGLNQQQLQQLKQMANAQQSACKDCKGMSDAMSQMAKQAKNGQSGKNGQQMQQMLSDAEQMQQMLMQAQSAKGQCKGGGKGKGKGGSPSDMLASLPTKPQPGNQQSPPGQGFGQNPNGGGSGNAPIQETKFGTRLQKEQVALQEGGDIISRQLVASDNPVVGQSTVEIQATADRIIRGWEEGGQDEVVPAHRRDGVKGYLGELTQRLKGQRRQAPTPPAATPASETAPASEPAPEPAPAPAPASSESTETE